jgi:hypothetical protein
VAQKCEFQGIRVFRPLPKPGAAAVLPVLHPELYRAIELHNPSIFPDANYWNVGVGAGSTLDRIAAAISQFPGLIWPEAISEPLGFALASTRLCLS